jgi:hypothetical protein
MAGLACVRVSSHTFAAHAPQVIFDNPLMAPSVGVVGCKLPAGGRAHACVLHTFINKDKEELVAKNATHIETT